jgi:YVTN family beta-propeller protein
MRTQYKNGGVRKTLLAATMLVAFGAPAFADVDDGRMDNEVTSPPLPTGQHIAPTAATGAYFTGLNPGLAKYPSHLVGQAIKTAVSPDGSTLLVLTSGYNNLNDPVTGAFDPAGSNEYVFVFDIKGGYRTKPKQTQVIQIPDSYVGMLFAPDGKTFYVSGGVDDVVYAYQPANGQWAQSGAVKLGHATGNGLAGRQGPTVASFALSQDGTKLVAANLYNDSVSVIDLASLAVAGELDLRPGIIDLAKAGVAGGEYPFGVAVKGNATAYVSSLRDREIDVVDITTAKPTLVTRIAVPGNPNSMVLNAAETLLYVAQDNTDTVAVIDTKTNRVIEEIRTVAPEGLLANPEHFTGAAPNGLALSPDGMTLYVTNGGANSVAVIDVGGAVPHRTTGLIPTGWYPHSVSLSSDGKSMYVVNGKSVPGPNPKNLTGATALLKDSGQTPAQNAAAAAAANASNQYIFQLENAGLLALPVPKASDLPNLTRIVAANNGYSLSPNAQDEAVMGVLRQRIQHVIYIVKENRTYDQVLGDLANHSNGDPALAVFGQVVTPNFHRIATNFVTLDNFFDSGEVSGNGWPWTTSARETDNIVKAIPLDYANSPLATQGFGRGAPYDAEGQNRGVDTGYPTVAARQNADPRYPNDPNLLPGRNNAGAPDGPDGQKQTGYIWDSALRAGLTVRNYGFLCDLNRYNSGDAAAIPLDLMPAENNPPTQVAYPVNPTLIPLTDVYFRGFDNAFPDIFREQEWSREFDGYVAKKNLPNLSLVRLMHDHMGNFGSAILGVNFPEAQQADNDYAVGLLVDKVAHSPYKDNTLIFVIEDDAQDGPDHVDAHRSTGYIVGPYIKQHAIVSTRYSTVNMLRTIEDVLGMDHLNLNDAYQRPMTEIFDLNQKNWTFHAQGSSVLNQTQVSVQLPMEFASAEPYHVAHPAAYWESETRGFDWSKEDRVPAVLFNQIVWKGLIDGAPYPVARDGVDLRNDREKLIEERGLHTSQPTN